MRPRPSSSRVMGSGVWTVSVSGTGIQLANGEPGNAPMPILYALWQERMERIGQYPCQAIQLPKDPISGAADAVERS